MRNRTKFLGSVASVCGALAAIVGLSSSPVSAKPDNAADPTSGLGCGVADATGHYTYDADCEYHYLRKTGRDGTPQIASYHDHGTLPGSAAFPERTRHSTIAFDINVDGHWAHCTGNEITTPSGDYRSDCRIDN